MRFGHDLTEDQQAIYEAAQTFAAEQVAPGAAARDKSGAFPTELVSELAEMGFLAMRVPMEEGGGGTDMVSYVLAMQAISQACASTGVIMAVCNLTAGILSKHGTDEQKQRYLQGFCEGRFGPGTFCLSEPHCGSDAAALKSTAVRDGEDYVVSGSKMWITNGGHAGLHAVFVKTAPELGGRGISCLLIEKGTAGLEIGKEEPKMGQKAAAAVALHLQDCRVPAANVLGLENEGYGIALGTLAVGRIGIAALCLGIGEAAIGEGTKYALERKAFGKSIADFQAIQFALADSRVDLDQAWLLTMRAAQLIDQGDRAAAESSMAKLSASEACGRVVDRMLQVHGGYGYSSEYTIERLFRDARVTRIYEGSSEVQRMVIARELLKNAQ